MYQLIVQSSPLTTTNTGSKLGIYLFIYLLGLSLSYQLLLTRIQTFVMNAPGYSQFINLKCFAYSYFILPFHVKVNICDEYS